MAAHADAVVVFPGGSGTRDMLSQARRAGLQIFDVMAEGPGHGLALWFRKAAEIQADEHDLNHMSRSGVVGIEGYP